MTCPNHYTAIRPNCLPVPGMAPSAVILVTLLFSLPVFSQSGSDIENLFFDAVYFDDQEQILLSSGDRFDGDSKPADNAKSTTTQDPVRPLPELLQDIENYQANINRQIEEKGAFDPGLAQEYIALGNIQALTGDQESAVASYESAMHIDRINEGLYTLSQETAVRKLIEINKNALDYPEADKYHQYLYYLLSRNLEDSSKELQDAGLEWANWNVNIFRRMAFKREEGFSFAAGTSTIPSTMLRRGEMIAMVNDLTSEVRFVSRSDMFAGNSMSYTPDQLLDPRLEQARDVYDKLLEHDSLNRDILTRKANIIYLFKYQLEEYLDVDVLSSPLASNRSNISRSIPFVRRGYSEIRDSLTRIAESLDDDPVSAARAYLDLGDWELMFDRLQRAEAAYQQAYTLLTEHGIGEEETAQILNPEPAYFIPENITYEYTRAFLGIEDSIDIPYIGYLDVTMDKRENGSLRNVDIVSTSENTGQLVRNRLLELLREVITRPTLVGGERQELRDIKVRFYYAY